MGAAHAIAPVALSALAWSACAQPATPYPYPLITEVLYAVPNTDGADPSGDGKRESVGDEFVEIVNPLGEAIDLTGYTICDATGWHEPENTRAFRFRFPYFSLPAGGVAVVFNGNGTLPAGAYGTASGAPAGPSSAFHGAWVFTAHNTSRSRGFANSDEFVALVAPDGTPVDVIAWGRPEGGIPPGALRAVTLNPDSSCSAQRARPENDPMPHTVIDTALYSPGRIPEIARP